VDSDEAIRRRLVEAQQVLATGLHGMVEAGLVVPEEGRAYALGTTLPLLLPPRMVALPSGLVVPASAAATKYPIDLIATYITGREVFGRSLSREVARRALRFVPRQRGIAFCAQLMRRHESDRHNLESLDHQLVDEWFVEEHRPRLHAMLTADKRRLLTEQGVLTLLKQVLADCESAPAEPDSGDEGLIAAYFILLDHLRAIDDDDSGSLTDVGRRQLAAEMVSNQWFNTDVDIVGLLARHAQRWASGDADEAEPREEYQRCTGLELRLAEMVVLALWAVSNGGTIWTTAETLVAATDLPVADAQAVLDLLSASPEDLRARIERDDLGGGVRDWNFSVFEQYPLIADDGGVVIVSPQLLLRRVFSWTAIWDVASSDLAMNKRVFVRMMRHRAEGAVRAAFEAMFPVGAGKRLYDEDDQAEAFAKGDLPKRADFVVDDVDCWLVVEITSSMPTRETVASLRDDAYLDDIEKLVEKVRQIDSSIGLLRADESALTNAEPRPRRFIPMLVCTEGFPVNPVTIGDLTRRIEEEGLLDGADVELLRVLSSQDVEAAEAFMESEGVRLAELLQAHIASGLRDQDLRSYLIAERRPTRIRPRRFDAVTDDAFGPLMESLVDPGQADREETD
jgi:hypothetical protein